MLEAAVVALTAATLAVGLVGLGVRFILLPWLREHLVDKVEETHRQVSVNKHQSRPPTLLDRVDTLTRLFTDHVEWSTTEHERLEQMFAHLRKDKPHE